jgi:hypothetical protein
MHLHPNKQMKFCYAYIQTFYITVACDVADFHDVDAGEAIHRANGGVDPLVLAQHSQEAQSVERPVREARLGGQLPHVCDRSPANGQGRHVLPP